MFGKRLTPLTLGHVLLLCRDGNALVTGAKSESMLWHLVRAIYVCSRDCRAAAEGLQRARTLVLLKLWKWQIAVRCTEAEIDQAINVISDWLDVSYSGPSVWQSEDSKGRKLSAPFVQVLKVRLMSYFGCSPVEALGYPLREAIWDMSAWLEEESRVEWVSADEAAAVERAMAN